MRRVRLQGLLSWVHSLLPCMRVWFCPSLYLLGLAPGGGGRGPNSLTLSILFLVELYLVWLYWTLVPCRFSFYFCPVKQKETGFMSFSLILCTKTHPNRDSIVTFGCCWWVHNVALYTEDTTSDFLKSVLCQLLMEKLRRKRVALFIINCSTFTVYIYAATTYYLPPEWINMNICSDAALILLRLWILFPLAYCGVYVFSHDSCLVHLKPEQSQHQ